MSQCLKIAQNVAFEFFNYGIFNTVSGVRAIDFAAAVGNEIAIPFKCKNVELTLSKEEEELFEVIKKNEVVLKIILESDEESA